MEGSGETSCTSYSHLAGTALESCSRSRRCLCFQGLEAELGWSPCPALPAGPLLAQPGPQARHRVGCSYSHRFIYEQRAQGPRPRADDLPGSPAGWQQRGKLRPELPDMPKTPPAPSLFLSLALSPVLSVAIPPSTLVIREHKGAETPGCSRAPRAQHRRRGRATGNTPVQRHGHGQHRLHGWVYLSTAEPASANRRDLPGALRDTRHGAAPATGSSAWC